MRCCLLQLLVFGVMLLTGAGIAVVGYHLGVPAFFIAVTVILTARLEAILITKIEED